MLETGYFRSEILKKITVRSGSACVKNSKIGPLPLTNITTQGA